MKANELKVTDLMVGDWVMSFGAPHKVVGIRTDMFEPHIKTDMSDTWYEEGIENLLEPIPLTPEILEKNGFYRSEIPTRDEIGHYYHRKTAPSSIFVSMSFDDGRDFGNEIKYVHELQHVLKLCGIDKEIVV
jgi:hypothetical protein